MTTTLWMILLDLFKLDHILLYFDIVLSVLGQVRITMVRLKYWNLLRVLNERSVIRMNKVHLPIGRRLLRDDVIV
jgi:hypothetical protein